MNTHTCMRMYDNIFTFNRPFGGWKRSLVGGILALCAWSTSTPPTERWCLRVTPVLERERQEDQKFQVILSCIVNLRSAWLHETMPQKRKNPFVQIFVQILVIFCQLDSSYSQLRRGNLRLENASIWLAYWHACGTFSWLTIDEGGPSPLWALPPLGMWYWVYKK